MNLPYFLTIDGPALRHQRAYLLSLRESWVDTPELDGIIHLLDEIADQAHDKYEIDCLLEEHDGAPTSTRGEHGTT